MEAVGSEVFANRISYFELLKSNILEIATCFRQIHVFPPGESKNSGQKRVSTFFAASGNAWA
jgi:hypothetical protein